MRNFTFFIVAASVLAIARGANAETIDLFNGKDLSGWTQKTGIAKYRVEDGCIVGETLAGTRTNSFLCTTKDYDNFILDLDFKVDPRLNSGVQFRSQYADQPAKVEWNGKTINVPQGYVYGYQLEIDPDTTRNRMWTGGIYDERRRLWLYPGQVGGDAKEFTEQGQKTFKPGDWNHLRIEAIGDSIKTYLNGTLRARIDDSLTTKGFIGLQVHQVGDDQAKNGAQVRFKNIKLQTVEVPRTEARVNRLTDEEKKAGWRLLWDGETTKGWRSPKSDEFPQKGWTIKDGALHVTDNAGAESSGGGDIITRERFSDFELLADFKITPGANSGIKYFVQPNLDPITGSGSKTSVGSAIGLEYQVLDDERHPDAKLGRDGNRTLGSLYDLKTAAASKKPKAIGEWNTAHIVVQGNHVEYRLNGEKILEYDRGTPEFRELVAKSKYKNIPGFGEWPDGHILLQEHGSAVSFRNLKIRVPAK